MFNNFPDVLSVKDVCTALGLGKNTVYALLKSETIKSLPIRGKYVIPKEYLIDFIENQR